MNRFLLRPVIVVSGVLLLAASLRATPGEEGVPVRPVRENEIREGDVQKRLFEVARLFSQRKFEEAARMLDEIETIAPQSRDVESFRAGIYAETGRYEEARLIYEKQAQEDPKAFAPRYNLVEIKMLQKDFAGARKGFESLHQEFPTVDFVLFKLVLSCLQEKDLPSARKWAQKLYRGQRNPLIYYAAAAIAFSQGDMTNGRRLIEATEREFGAGRHALLYQSLAGVGLVVGGDYPPKPLQTAAP